MLPLAAALPGGGVFCLEVTAESCLHTSVRHLIKILTMVLLLVLCCPISCIPVFRQMRTLAPAWAWPHCLQRALISLFLLLTRASLSHSDTFWKVFHPSHNPSFDSSSRCLHRPAYCRLHLSPPQPSWRISKNYLYTPRLMHYLFVNSWLARERLLK